TLISGPTPLDTPVGVRRIDVETAAEMHDAVRPLLPDADVLVMAAAVADFRPAAPAGEKIKKDRGEPPAIGLEATADILRSTRSDRKSDAVIVGFALETGNALEKARLKLESKGLDILVVNDARA